MDLNPEDPIKKINRLGPTSLEIGRTGEIGIMTIPGKRNVVITGDGRLNSKRYKFSYGNLLDNSMVIRFLNN